MPSTGRRRMLLEVCVAASSLLLGSVYLLAQDSPQAALSISSPAQGPAQSSDELRALADTVRALQAQVLALTTQLGELRAEEQREREETRALQGALDLAGAQPAPSVDPSNSFSSLSLGPKVAFLAPQSLPASIPAAPPQTTQERLATIEDDLQLANAKINDQYLTKVESGSKYRVRLSGSVLLNMFENRGTVDNLDFPQLAFGESFLGSSGSFGGSLRQSQIGIDVFGPNIAGARTSASLKFDFAGGFADTPNGVAEGLVRLRTGTIRMDWNHTSLVAGQDYLFFAPLAPTSLATMALPALSYSGNLWGWTPQLRLEHTVTLSESSSLLFQGGILDSFSGDLPYSEYSRYPSWGEESGQPAYAARISWSHRLLGQNFIAGFGGYYGRQDWGFGRRIDGWASTTDVTLPLGRFFGLTGEFYRGRAVGGLGGGIGQDVVVSDVITKATAVVRGLDSTGGWLQLKFKPVAKFEVNGAFGQDNPFASELGRYNSTSESYYGVLLARNRTPMVNFIYQVRSNVLFSIEYRHLQTFALSSASSANHVNVSLGYEF